MKVDGAAPKDQRILAAAERVFSLYGYEKATLDEIIRLADVGKGTVYKYFGSKEQLFYRLAVDKNRVFVERLQRAVDGSGALQEQLTAYFREFVDFYSQNSSLWQIIFFEMLGSNNVCRVQKIDGVYQVLPRYSQLQLSEEAKEQVLRYHDLLAAEYVILEKIIMTGIREGEIKSSSNVEISSKYLFFGVAMSIFNQAVENKLTPEEAADIIIDRYLYGEHISGRPQHKA